MNRSFLLLVAGVLAFGMTAQAGEFDLFFEVQTAISHPLSEDWKVEASEKLYYTDTGRLFIHETDGGLIYTGLAAWIDLGFFFKYAEGNKDGDNWIKERRPHFNVKIKSKLGDFPWSSRARIEYRDFDEKKDHWRFRNKLILDMPFEIPVISARPFIGDEVFFNLSENGFNQNRVYTGLKFKLAKNLKATLYYYWLKGQTSSGWDEASVIGCNAALSF